MIGPESLRSVSDYNKIQSEKQSPWKVVGGGNLIWRSSSKSVGRAKRPNGGQESNLEISNKRKLPTLPGLERQRTEALQSPEARTAWDLWESGPQRIHSCCQKHSGSREMGRYSLVCFLLLNRDLESVGQTSCKQLGKVPENGLCRGQPLAIQSRVGNMWE